MARWRNYFSQILNVRGVSDVRQAERHTAEPLVSEPSVLEVELAIEKLKSHKSPGVDQIPAELIKAGGRTIRCAIYKLIISVCEHMDYLNAVLTKLTSAGFTVNAQKCNFCKA
jgi:hypothetical protein